MEENSPILQILKEHSSEVTTCDISQNNVLATGAGDKTVRVWEWKTGHGFSPAAYSPLPPHKYGVTCVRFSPQGTMLASSSIDGTIVLWNVRTGSKIRTFVQTTRCSVRRLEFTPDSSRLFTVGYDGVFCLWDLLYGSLVNNKLHYHDEEDSLAQALSISSDGQLMATGDSGGLLLLWTVGDQSLVCICCNVNTNNGVACCAFSPIRNLTADEGEDVKMEYTLATSGSDGVIRIFAVTAIRGYKDVVKGELTEIDSFEGHESDVHEIRFNSSGTLIASTGLDKLLKIWRVADGVCLHTFSGHTRYGNCCAFTKDSTMVVTGSNDKSLIVWDLTGNLSLEHNLSPLCTVASHFSTEHSINHEQLMAGHVEQNSIKLEIVEVLTCSGVVNSVAFGGSNRLAVAGGEKLVRVYEKKKGEWTEQHVVDVHRYSIYQVAFSSCGEKLLSCSLDGMLLIYMIQLGVHFEMKTEECKNGLRTCAFSPTKNIVAAGGDDEVVFLWDVSAMEFSKSCMRHRDAITDLSFSTDGELLASTSSAGDIMIYDFETEAVCWVKDNAHDLGALSCNFAERNFLPSEDGGNRYVLATCGNDSAVRIWIGSANQFEQHKELTGHGGNVMMVRFAPATPILLASCATDNTTRIWNAKSGECVLVVEHHSSMVNSCAFSYDSTLLATGSLDKTVVIWRLPSQLDAGEVTSTFRLKKRVQEWTAEDLSQWLIDLGHPDVAESALKSEITGNSLLTLSEEKIMDTIGLEDEEERQEIAQLLWWGKQSAQGVVGREEGAPHQFLCPITHDVMLDPVLCADGFTYERAAITEWMLGGRYTSPMTNESFKEPSFVPNATLKKAIYQFLYGERPNTSD